MIVTTQAIERLSEHWAVLAIKKPQRQRAEAVARHRHITTHLGQQLNVPFDDQARDEQCVQSLALAYELAAVEGLDALLHPSHKPEVEALRDQAVAGAYMAYELGRAVSVPVGDDERVFHILHLAALAYCGDRWADIRRWIGEHPTLIQAPSVADVSWDKRVTYRLFECWIRLLRKNRWDDLDGVREIVSLLRQDQLQYEDGVLQSNDVVSKQAMACRLIALYNWAKATEQLAVYMLQGQPANIATQLDQFFEASRDAALASGDLVLDVVLKWLHVASRQMAAGSVWSVTQRVNSRVTKFVERVTKSRAMFELLPPQRAALLEQGLLDPAHAAVVVDLPTSGGKTALAQFRILQALNQFDVEKGWIAYVAPTRALTSQITRRLREDFEPLGINVEQLSAAVEVDAFEETLLAEGDGSSSFHVLVATPEKLDLVLRNRKVARPLALLVMDEAHNLEDEERGLRIELLLATVKRDYSKTSFLLLMPNVPNAAELASWLGANAGRAISLASSAWQPNERMIGLFKATKNEPKPRSAWHIDFETVLTDHRTIQISGTNIVGSGQPLSRSFSKVSSLSMQTAAMAKVFSERGNTSIAVGRTIDDTWAMARAIKDDLQPLNPLPEDVGLVQRFLQTEISSDFELVDMLGRGVAVHHSGLSEEARALIEWLAETNQLRVLCSTSTVAQGINFPVSSVFLASTFIPHGHRSVQMSSRAFWNMAGRAGRFQHGSIGVVGIASGEKTTELKKFVRDATVDLVSRLVSMLDAIEASGKLNQLSLIIHEEQWTAFRSYVAHLWAEKNNLDAVLLETEQLLRNTLGYGVLQSQTDAKSRGKAKALLDATRAYATSLASNPGAAMLADSTGFAPEGVAKALAGLSGLPRKLTTTDWQADSLFGGQARSVLPQLIGVMMRVPEIQRQLVDIAGNGIDHKRLSQIAHDWVSGKSIQQIATQHFTDDGTSQTDALTTACKAIYRNLAGAGTWGLSAISKLGPSGLDYDNMSADAKRGINLLPAMLYHGVRSEGGVLMRMNCVPRSIAESLGAQLEESVPGPKSTRIARQFLRTLTVADWAKKVPAKARMDGEDYRAVWSRLAGEPT